MNEQQKTSAQEAQDKIFFESVGKFADRLKQINGLKNPELARGIVQLTHNEFDVLNSLLEKILINKD